MATNDPTIAYATVDTRVYQLVHGDPVPHDVTGDLVYLTTGPFTGVGLLRSIVYVPSATNGDRTVAAAEGGVPGVYMMTIANPGVWTRVGVNLPSSDAMALDYDSVNSMLVVGTGGRGAWSLTGATSLDRAPKALCKNLTQSAGPTCTTTVTPAAFNNGSSDPDGNPLTIIAVDPITLAPVTFNPFGLGIFNVAIKFSDDQARGAVQADADRRRHDATGVAGSVREECDDLRGHRVGRDRTGHGDRQLRGGPAAIGPGHQPQRCDLRSAHPRHERDGESVARHVRRALDLSDGANAPVQANQTVTVGAGIEVSQSSCSTIARSCGA